jgi:transcriptional regulator with XRE-family HTH domain
MRLKEIRVSKGLSVPQLAQLSGVPRRTIQNVEKNDESTVSTALKLSRALGVTLDELCGNKEV